MEIGGIGSRVGMPYFVQRKQNIEQSVSAGAVAGMPADAMEMFAFCQYADATGTGVDDKWGSWHALKFFASPMEALEYKSFNDAMYKKQDWTMALAGNADYSLKSQSTGETLDVYDVFKMLKSTLVEQHKLTAKDTKAEDDWRKMEDEKWQKLIERIDRYINASVEELKKIREAQNEAINVAASEAPADMKSQAVNMAMQNILLSGKMGQLSKVYDEMDEISENA
ncbi:MAG: hypothetical protein IJ655_07460 [Lachnospiraceae bacterium]|nr:hypothetical protein [Lachnospiraceae bacterium]